jgi:uncharacterized repeat protein (TIGR03843 family)
MAITAGEVRPLLTRGAMEIEGRLLDASNTTLRVLISADGVTARAVYKPIRGERPLWDFPDGTLAAREVAAYEVSAALGWEVVPPTVMRDGPLGPGSCQLWLDDAQEPPVGFVPADELPDGWLPILSAADDDGTPYLLAHADDERLARLALFDAVINNADRKGGHVLDVDGTLYGVDHGVCFHPEDKLRSVLWGFAGRPVPAELLARLAEINLAPVIAPMIAGDEVSALLMRVEALQRVGRFPLPNPDRNIIPWPPI